VSSPSASFAERVLAWYDHSGRKDLPWQQNPTPYRVWVSEIMLQQTQVQTVIPYYQRFMQRFPDVQTLASASLDAVLHHWSGLGYYARARNLHRTAQILCVHGKGEFPGDSEALMALPGIGRSTAGAILSLAGGQWQPILDGNVKRVLARFHAVAGWPGQAAVVKRLWQLSAQATPAHRVADYNQAMMDLGATLCRRAQPDCERCPLSGECAACRQDRVGDYPAPRPRRAVPVRETHMLLLVAGDEVCLQQRPARGIWGGLWSFPEFRSAQAAQAWCDQRLPATAAAADWPVLRHTFSHFHLDITPWVLRLENPVFSVMEGDGVLWYNMRQPVQLGLAAPVQRLLSSLQAEQN
jgi:A/G-specific adenine glycosylase